MSSSAYTALAEPGQRRTGTRLLYAAFILLSFLAIAIMVAMYLTARAAFANGGGLG